MPDPRGLIGIPIAILVAGVLGGRVAAATGSGRFTGSFLTFSVAAILAITLLPMPLVTSPTEGLRCLLPTLSVFRSGDLLRVTDVSLNVIMFVPLGLAVAWLPRRTLPRALALAVALPWVVESIQLAVPALGRTCQAGDITTNLMGLALGLLVGVVARAIAARGGGRGAGRT